MGMSREALWGELAGISVFEPMLMSAYRDEELRVWRGDLESSPHGAAWHTSFHASSIPGDDPYACGRRAIYELMNPVGQPIEPWLRGWFDLGKALELEWVRRFAYAGQLLSADQTAGDEHQTGFVDDEYWLSGSPDLLILPPRWRRSHAVEVKTTSHEKVEAMLADPTNTPNSHEKYLRQLKAYLALSNELPFAPEVDVCRLSGRLLREGSCAQGPLGEYRLPYHQGQCKVDRIQLSPPIDGTLAYSSREKPLTIACYWVNLDPAFIAASRAKLAEWKDSFLRGELPLHPRNDERAKWSVEPCQYCSFKKDICKPDFTKKITQLSESHLITYNQTYRPGYSYEATRQAVLDRWGVEDPLHVTGGSEAA